MDLSAMFAAGGITVTAGVAIYGVWRSSHNDKVADHAAAAETEIGMAGLVIAGWRDLVQEGRIREAEGHTREAQLRVDLDACVERARRRAARSK